MKAILERIRFISRPLAMCAVIAVVLLTGSSRESVAAAAKVPTRASPEFETIVSGGRTWEEWQSQTDWDSYTAASYKPSKKKIRQISRLAGAKNVRFAVFAGSWCKDSEAQLPILMKLLGAAGIPSRNVTLVGVDAQMKEPSGQSEHFALYNVPTLIILAGERELGRIVERPRVHWEDDILSILSSE